MQINNEKQLETFKFIVPKLPGVVKKIHNKEAELLRTEQAYRQFNSQCPQAFDKQRTYTPNQFIDAITERINHQTEVKRLQAQCKAVSDELLNLRGWVKQYLPHGIWFKVENFVVGISTQNGKVWILPQYQSDDALPVLGGKDA